tara:strand:- start:7829 stop:8710 length:882 start_codon:yes stop_codon:yes gene_type:complete
MGPLVSIIIPTFNRKNELDFAISSVMSQSYRNWELIIVDNHSTDGTSELIAELDSEKVKHIKINNYGIIAASRNKGIEMAKGDYIAFLDSDDWWISTKLECCINEVNKGYDFIYHDLIITKVRKNINSRNKISAWQLSSKVYEDLVFLGNPIATSSVVVKIDLLKKVNGFSENKNLIAAEDYDCWLRISKLTNKFKALQSPLGYWFHGGNTSASSLSLIFLETLYELHVRTLIDGSNKKLPVWWIYAKGRALYQEGNLFESKILLAEIIKRKTSVMIKLKATFMLFNIFIKGK